MTRHKLILALSTAGLVMAKKTRVVALLVLPHSERLSVAMALE